MGGSEEAVLYLSQQLALLGHYVVVYADPPKADLAKPTPEGVVWRHHSQFDQDKAEDVFISWRLWYEHASRAKSMKRYLWLQDLVGKESIPPPDTVAIDNLLVLSEFHRRDVIRNLRNVGWNTSQAETLTYVMPNAAVDTRILPFMEGSNDNFHFVYGSSPVRGLEQILVVWQRLRQTLYEKAGKWATLSVYYGFPPKVVEQLRKSMGAGRFDSFYERVMGLLNQPGVEYYGAVGHEDLAKAYASAGFLYTQHSTLRQAVLPFKRLWLAALYPSQVGSASLSFQTWLHPSTWGRRFPWIQIWTMWVG